MAVTKALFNVDDFARKLRVAMADRDINMRDAAKQIGCSHATVSRVSNGKKPDVENYLRMERWIVGGSRGK